MREQDGFFLAETFLTDKGGGVGWFNLRTTLEKLKKAKKKKSISCEIVSPLLRKPVRETNTSIVRVDFRGGTISKRPDSFRTADALAADENM